MKLTGYAYSAAGPDKQINQDSALLLIADTPHGKASLSVVCDGVGGLEKGELASSALVRVFALWFECELEKYFTEKVLWSRIRKDWIGLCEKVNKRLLSYGREKGCMLGSTLSVLLTIDRDYLLLHLGDCRIYLLTKRMELLSKDHTYVQREVDLGHISYEESIEHPKRNVLLQCVGVSESMEPMIRSGTVAEDTVMLLCSDGFRHKATEKEIFDILAPSKIHSEAEMKKAVDELVRRNRKREEMDDITVVIIRIGPDMEARC